MLLQTFKINALRLSRKFLNVLRDDVNFFLLRLIKSEHFFNFSSVSIKIGSKHKTFCSHLKAFNVLIMKKFWKIHRAPRITWINPHIRFLIGNFTRRWILRQGNGKAAQGNAGVFLSIFRFSSSSPRTLIHPIIFNYWMTLVVSTSISACCFSSTLDRVTTNIGDSGGRPWENLNKR